MSKSGLINELVKLTVNWNDYEDIPKSQQTDCRRIGTELNELGGKPLMEEAYYAAKASNKHVHVIRAYWNGVGDWMW